MCHLTLFGILLLKLLRAQSTLNNFNLVELAMAEFLRVGNPAPDFEADAVVDQEFTKIKLSSYQKNKYVVLFFIL